jgi:hypothetical protein
MPLHIAVPSYKRVQILQDKTLAFLDKHGLLDLVTVFVADQEEYKLYHDAIGTRVQVVVGVPGIGPQRKFIYRYFPEDSYVFCIDDDIKDLIGLQKGALNAFGLRALIDYGFSLCENNKCRLWGIYPVANPFFMSQEYTTKLCYICACFFGYIKRGPEPPQPDDSWKEDIYRSCSYYKTDGKVVRINSFAPLTKYYLKNGGLYAEGRTRETDLQGCQRIAADFPTYVEIYYKKKTNWPEIRFRRQPKIERPPTPEL